jgi:cell wall-associated NlpC family hydrolase
MPSRPTTRLVRTLLLAGSVLLTTPALADESAAGGQDGQSLHPSTSLIERAASTAGAAVTRALELVGIRYRRGGTTPESGFDCSGLVDHVFREGFGLILPHNAREISKTGEKVQQDDLRPGDLVFFNTMRRAFSHVGIYLGDNQFVHAPRSGGEVRVEDMRENYWAKRFNGARRMAVE